MADKGQQPTSGRPLSPSALPPQSRHREFATTSLLRANSGCEQSQQRSPLFDDFVRAGEQRRRHGQTECLRSLEIDGQLEFYRLLDRQFGWLFPFEDAPDVAASDVKGVANTSSVYDKPASDGILTQVI